MRVTIILILMSITATGAAAQVGPDEDFRASMSPDLPVRLEPDPPRVQRRSLLRTDPHESKDGWKWGLGVGAFLGGTVGAFAGHFAENFMTDQEVEAGTGTVIGSVVGLTAGALVGAGIAWLIDH